MKSTRGVWVGVDPGGKDNFGVAVLGADELPITKCVSCADEAVEWIEQSVQGNPSGVGVDAPLWWSSGVSGDRAVDRWLRRNYGLKGGEVQAANSLRGAALVQGAMFVMRIREKYPSTGVTETHPKALLKAFDMDARDFAERYGCKFNGLTEHERDAFVSAVAAREGFEGRWTKDLTSDPPRLPSEQDPAHHWLGSLHYFWPD